jgi:hypothetical protein
MDFVVVFLKSRLAEVIVVVRQQIAGTNHQGLIRIAAQDS